MAQAAFFLLLVKSLIWVIALGSGTSGGVLAPLLIMGCGLGAVEALFFTHTLKIFYPLISMAAVMGGMMRAPFTSVLFALELTHNIDAMVPIFVATLTSYTVTVIIMRRSILTEKVARRGYELFREYEVSQLEIVRVREVMSKHVITIPENLPVETLISTYFNRDLKFRGYPVVSDDGVLQGILTISDVLVNKVQSLQHEMCARNVASSNVITIYPDETCREAAEKMAMSDIGRLPVVSVENPRKILGIVTRTDLLKPHVIHHELEEKREQFFKERRKQRDEKL